ncbi:hypothetical protein BDY19DRAFT_998873 [Irpex rosettiformis]|uniref:Uncharacterized protein n=1 Tax=Irpex rosettiformis TaxID=378272 RepID=A0ACB8TM65_9APHY|nr:hypothetical protein BDY19DRAFT_998873 [Irpex rosettiformis]
MARNVDKPFMRTRAGFFTALLFRNISFNSVSFLTCPSSLAKFKFEDLDEWNNYISALRDHFPNESEDFFCNRFALGQPIAERTVEQAEYFWKASNSCEWPEPEDWPVDFMNMYDRLTRIKGKHSLPGCGQLSLYLLCADMVYYDLVECPSSSDMASIILSLGRGALSGLQILGYLKEEGKESLTVDAVRVAFEQFTGDITLLLYSAQELPRLKLTTIDLEHILCKYSRMWTLKFYQSFPSS